jgi:hypothetical protein
MWLIQLYRTYRGRRVDGGAARSLPALRPSRRVRVRLQLEPLEDRNLPSSYTASTVSDLINDINAANKSGGTNTITLAANTTFDLTAVNNTADGPSGLPVIKQNDALTVTGQGGDVLQRDTAAPSFRLFDVASRAALTLSNLTLQNGLALGSGSAADGGAIYNQGSVTLTGVTVQNNTAEGADGAAATKDTGNGQSGQDGAGGGIWSGGSLTLQGGTTVQNNRAVGGFAGNGGFKINALGMVIGGGIGGNGGNAYGGGVWSGGSLTVQGSISCAFQGNSALGGDGNIGGGGDGGGGNASGGGVYVAGGTATLNNTAIASNAVKAGQSQAGTPAVSAGGGLYVAAGTVTLSNDSVASNTAMVPNGPGGSGGGIYIATAATVHLDSYTVSHTINNTAGTDPDIDGTYILS